MIENLDWSAVFEKYDGPETVFYCDLPYVGKEDYYLINTIDHEKLVNSLGALEGDWLLSYSDLPDSLDSHHIVERASKNYINSGKSGSANNTCERLVMNFQPSGSAE